MSASSPSSSHPLRAVAAAALLAALAAAGCNRAAGPPPTKTVEVEVTTPTPDVVIDYQDFTGRIDALKTVDVKARVTGYVVDAPFKEGDLVRENDLLFQIDPRSFQADLAQAEANLRLAVADRKLQEKNAERARRLITTGAIGKEEFDQIMANLEKSGATIKAMEAARDRAKLYLDYTEVTAPLSGRISRRNVDPGNLVNADNTLLTTIVTVDPVYAYFDVDERTFLDLVKAAESGEGPAWSGLSNAVPPTAIAAAAGLAASPAGPAALAAAGTLVGRPTMSVVMRLTNEEDFTHVGRVNFLDNRLNANTGTIRMRGVFANPTGSLKSGLFVRVRLPSGNPYPTLLISDEALLSDQGRKYVYVVNAENKVEYRPVVPGQALHGLRAIKEGLSSGDRVIVTGMQRVRPGAPVKPTDVEPARPPRSPLKDLLASNRKAVRSP